MLQAEPTDLGPHEHLYVVDLSENTVRLPFVEGGEPALPGLDGLTSALRPIAERIRALDTESARLGRAGAEADAVLGEAVGEVHALLARWQKALLRQMQTSCDVRQPASCATRLCHGSLTAEGWVVQAANPFDVDECVGQFTGRHAGFLNAFAATQMFAVYAEQHIPELEPEPQPEPEPA